MFGQNKISIHINFNSSCNKTGFLNERPVNPIEINQLNNSSIGSNIFLSWKIQLHDCEKLLRDLKNENSHSPTSEPILLLQIEVIFAIRLIDFKFNKFFNWWLLIDNFLSSLRTDYQFFLDC